MLNDTLMLKLLTADATIDPRNEVDEFAKY